MKIKRIIGYILITALWGGLIYFYATQVPWYVILIALGTGIALCAFAAVLAWLFYDPDQEEEDDEIDERAKDFKIWCDNQVIAGRTNHKLFLDWKEDRNKSQNP